MWHRLNVLFSNHYIFFQPQYLWEALPNPQSMKKSATIAAAGQYKRMYQLVTTFICPAALKKRYSWGIHNHRGWPFDLRRFPRSLSILSVTSGGVSSSWSWLSVEVWVNQAKASTAASLSASCLFFFGFPTNCIPLNSTSALNSFVLRCFVLYLGGEWPALIKRVCSKLLGFVPSFVNLLLSADSFGFLLARPNTNLPSHWSPVTSSWTASIRYLPSLWMSMLQSSSCANKIQKAIIMQCFRSMLQGFQGKN